MYYHIHAPLPGKLLPDPPPAFPSIFVVFLHLKKKSSTESNCASHMYMVWDCPYYGLYT